MRWPLLLLLLAVALATPDNNNDGGSLGSTQLYSDLADFSGNTPRLDNLLYAIEPKLEALYQLCRRDPVCSSRFYLASAAGVEAAGNDAARRLQTSDVASDQKKFYRLLVFWASQDDCPLRPNAVRGQVTLSDYDEEDAPWWLTVLNTARICGDNQVWETGQGCVIKPDRVDDDGQPVRTKSTLDSVGQPIAVLAVVIFSILILAAIVAGIYIANHNFSQMVNYIRGAGQLFDGTPPRDTKAMTKRMLLLQHVGSAIDADDEFMGAADVVAHVSRH